MEILLSFLVVTHNHEKCVNRCLDSILKQDIKVPFEVIVGDDHSADETWNIIKEYKEKYPNIFIIYQINSDDCNPLSLSDRASYNRGYGYKLIRGKYYAEVDGDDFLLPGDTYQKQVELLEAHTDCWLCMQNISNIEEGQPFSSARRWFRDGLLDDFQTITAEYYISHPGLFSQHQSFVFRRNINKDPIGLLGLDYEDTTVTLFHLQFGSIIYLNQSGYQYIRYSYGISRRFCKDDRMVSLALLQLKHMSYFSCFSKLILIASLPQLVHLLKVTCERNIDLSSGIQKSFSKYNGFLFRFYEKNNHSLAENIRIRVLRLLLLFMNRYKKTSNVWVKVAKRLLF